MLNSIMVNNSTLIVPLRDHCVKRGCYVCGSKYCRKIDLDLFTWFFVRPIDRKITFSEAVIFLHVLAVSKSFCRSRDHFWNSYFFKQHFSTFRKHICRMAQNKPPIREFDLSRQQLRKIYRNVLAIFAHIFAKILFRCLYVAQSYKRA